MEWTMGIILTVAGIAGCIISVLLFIVFTVIFRFGVKKLIRKIELEY